jgi:hypothetical protein
VAGFCARYITWSELAIAHRDLTAARRSPSGFSNHYEAISYRFPPAVEITGLSALSDAIVCRSRWSSFLVQEDRDLFLRPETEAMKAVEKWRIRAIRTAIHAYQTVKNAEIRAFEKKFFYHLKAMAQGDPILNIPDDDDPEPEIQEE